MTNLSYEERHKCSDCDKNDVCKYAAQRAELTAKVKELCDPLNARATAFTVSFNCNHWRKDKEVL